MGAGNWRGLPHYSCAVCGTPTQRMAFRPEAVALCSRACDETYDPLCHDQEDGAP